MDEVVFLNFLSSELLERALVGKAEGLVEVSCASLEVGGVSLHILSHAAHVLIVSDTSEEFLNEV